MPIGIPYFEALTAAQSSSITSSASARHTHSNKSTLDNIEAAYTSSEKTKLSNLTDSFKGVFANQAAITSAYASPAAGWSAWNLGTSTMWYVSSGVWTNSGVASLGDMLKSMYDPQSKGADCFLRSNHSGTQSITTIVNLGSASVASNGSLTLPADLVVEANASVSGTLSSSGQISATNGLYIPAYVPTVKTNALYADGTTLKWNGSTLAMGGSISGTARYLGLFTASDTIGISGIYQDANNNVGIGTTSPPCPLTLGDSSCGTWDSNYRVIDLLGCGTILGSHNGTGWSGTGYGQTAWANNTYYNGTSKAIGTGAASSILQGTGQVEFQVAPSVAAGATQTFISAMHITNSGRVGIGTISPTSPLQVIGVSVFADNAAATTGGLTAGAFYRTSTGQLMCVY